MPKINEFEDAESGVSFFLKRNEQKIRFEKDGEAVDVPVALVAFAMQEFGPFELKADRSQWRGIFGGADA